ncbi:putative E3 ubiquitin-protein ligase RF4 isoform X2 [Vigna angularis]|uniref:putative E3 ubiquitin-protein ligase RF4 isoform X2 n=1 Tax=Phaseolus angularis TaxID=3914 RepID=UPI0022B3AD3D|nr:putative E3 ubiquitin-protein ligase RF4 isoform X2 [Vigna angularis]
MGWQCFIDTGNSSFCSQSCGSCPRAIAPEMDKTGGEDRQDKGCKNKRKLSHPSILPASLSLSLFDFPRYEIPVSQHGLNGFSPSEWWSELLRRENQLQMRELLDWSDPIASQLEELLLSNLQAIFKCALKQVVELGFDEKSVEMSLARKALYIEEGDPVRNIVDKTVNVLKGKEDATDFVFESFQHLLHYTMVEMISVVREVKPSLTVGEAMWVLLICDLNLSLACAVQDCLGVVGNGENSPSSSSLQSKSEVQSSDIISNCSSPTLQKNLSSSHQNQRSGEPKFGSFPNSPSNQSSHATGGVKLKAENVSLPITAEKSSGTSGFPAHECKSGSCSKRHTRKEIAALRQKFFHMEKTYRNCGKTGFKSGKITSVGSLVVEKRVKPPSEIPIQQMKCGSSNLLSSKGVYSANITCHVSTSDASALPAEGNSGTLPAQNTISSSPMVNAKTSTRDSTSKPKSELGCSVKILDYCADIPFDEALGKYVPRDEKDELILKLIARLQELQDELLGWNNWTNQKVMQVTNRLGKLQPEFKTLRKEKQDAELLKKEKKLAQETALKRISEMENAMENTKRQIESAASATLVLKAENSLLKKDLDAAKLSVVKSMESHQQALEREQTAHKQVQSWENRNSLLRDELEKEKHKLFSLQQELHKEKNHQAKIEGRLAKERAAKEKLLSQAASIKKEREQHELHMKSEEDVIRRKAARDLQNYVEDIGKVEKELVDLKLKSDSEKIAALRRCVDERNDSFSGTKSTPNMKGNKKSDESKTKVSCQDNLAAGSLRREQECVMCLSEEMSVVFLPCSHQVVCAECNELHEKQGMKECPSCRTPIQRRIRAKFARR